MAQLIRVIRVIRGEKNIAVSFSSLLLGIRERFFGYTRTVFWAYAKGFLGVRKRFFGRTQKVFWAYAKGCLRRPSPLQGRRLNPVRTVPTLYQDGAFSQERRCFQSRRTILSVRKGGAHTLLGRWFQSGRMSAGSAFKYGEIPGKRGSRCSF